MEGNASRQQGARKVWMGGSEAQNLRLDCAPLNILSRVHFKVLNTPQCTGNNTIRTELYMRSFATCNTAYGSPWKRSVGWLQERVLAPSSWHWPSEPQKTRAPALVATQFSHYRSLLTMKISSISWGIIGCKIIMLRTVQSWNRCDWVLRPNNNHLNGSLPKWYAFEWLMPKQ